MLFASAIWIPAGTSKATKDRSIICRSPLAISPENYQTEKDGKLGTSAISLADKIAYYGANGKGSRSLAGIVVRRINILENTFICIDIFHFVRISIEKLPRGYCGWQVEDRLP